MLRDISQTVQPSAYFNDCLSQCSTMIGFFPQVIRTRSPYIDLRTRASSGFERLVPVSRPIIPFLLHVYPPTYIILLISQFDFERSFNFIYHSSLAPLAVLSLFHRRPTQLCGFRPSSFLQLHLHSPQDRASPLPIFQLLARINVRPFSNLQKAALLPKKYALLPAHLQPQRHQ